MAIFTFESIVILQNLHTSAKEICYTIDFALEHNSPTTIKNVIVLDLCVPLIESTVNVVSLSLMFIMYFISLNNDTIEHLLSRAQVEGIRLNLGSFFYKVY